MKKWLWPLLGLLLISILTFFCFQGKSEKIKKDLNTKGEHLFSQNGMDWIDVGVKGDAFKGTRIITLHGLAPNEEKRSEAELLARKIDGVSGVENYLKLSSSQKIVSSEIESSPPVEVSVSPSYFEVIKDKKGKILLKGDVANKKAHETVLTEAIKIFGSTNIEDQLKEVENRPLFWQKSILLGLNELKGVESGNCSIHNQNFSFSASVESEDKKEMILNTLTKNLESSYDGDYNISIRKILTVSSAESIVPKEEIRKNIVPTTVVQTTPIKAEELAQSCENRVKEILEKHKIHFQHNRADIKKESYPLLKEILSVMHSCPTSQITIVGHTDSAGSKSYNKKLSQRRAKSVMSYFVRKGMKLKYLKAIGLGEEHPISTNSTEEGKSKNRRIEFIVKGVK